jgi:hypothetical protein
MHPEAKEELRVKKLHIQLETTGRYSVDHVISNQDLHTIPGIRLVQAE